jgi:predicted phosphodiesterase
MAFTPEVKRKPTEDLDSYLIRLGENLELYGLTWSQAAELLNEECQEEYSEAKWRKDYAAYLRWKNFLTEKLVKSDEYLKEIEDASLSLKKERIKLQSEKIEYNRMLREDSRNELLEEKILEAINNRPTINIPEIIIKRNSNKRDYVFPVADVHYGAEFKLLGWLDEILNEYSPEIAQKRMWSALEQYVKQNDIDKINHVHLFNLGDSLDGILRMSQLQWIRLGNVDSAIEFAEFMSQWLNELSKYSIVDYYAVDGNHTELRLLNGKRGDFAHENMEKIVSHIIACNLKRNKNIKIHKCRPQMYVDVLGTKILAIHGHEERNLGESIFQYAQMYGHPVDLMISGHLHHSHEKTVGMNGLRDIKYSQVPSVVGIDDFSLKIKKTSNAGAELMVIEEGIGRVAKYEFRLK